MEELKPCPFCGGNDIQIDKMESFWDKNETSWRVLCIDCIAETAGDTKEQAIAAWNRRTDHIRDTAKKVSNADRIRSVSDEELHKFLLDFEAGDVDYAKTFCDLCCKDAALEQRSTDCEGCLLWWLKNDATLPQGINWLQQPVKEEHNEAD